ISGGSSQSTAGDLDWALVRYNADGSLDPAFGVEGKVTTPVSTGDDGISGLVLQPDGKLVAAGYSGVDRAFTVARYLTAGAQSLNISTRAEVGTGDDVLLGGFL